MSTITGGKRLKGRKKKRANLCKDQKAKEERKQREKKENYRNGGEDKDQSGQGGEAHKEEEGEEKKGTTGNGEGVSRRLVPKRGEKGREEGKERGGKKNRRCRAWHEPSAFLRFAAVKKRELKEKEEKRKRERACLEFLSPFFYSELVVFGERKKSRREGRKVR